MAKLSRVGRTVKSLSLPQTFERPLRKSDHIATLHNINFPHLNSSISHFNKLKGHYPDCCNRDEILAVNQRCSRNIAMKQNNPSIKRR